MNTKLMLNSFSIIENSVATDRFQELICIAQIDASSPDKYPEAFISAEIVDSNSLLMILVRDGQASINIDYNTYSIAPDTLAFIIPGHVFGISAVSPDFKARFLMVDKSLLDEIMEERKGFYNYFSLKKNPLMPVDPEENAGLERAILLLQEKTRLRTHLFQREVVYNTASALFLELMNIWVGKNMNMLHPILSRKEELVDKFLKLLNKYVREQHQLSFYAEKLFITPQYLSSILKRQTGKSGSKWINDALIMEAKRLIRAPYSTIQDVAYTLNFSDQSTFGKFFKKSLGISPLVYRKM